MRARLYKCYVKEQVKQLSKVNTSEKVTNEYQKSQIK